MSSAARRSSRTAPRDPSRERLGLGATPIHRHPVNPSRRTAKPGEPPHCPDTYHDLDDYPDDRYPDKSCRERRQRAAADAGERPDHSGPNSFFEPAGGAANDKAGLNEGERNDGEDEDA